MSSSAEIQKHLKQPEDTFEIEGHTFWMKPDRDVHKSRRSGSAMMQDAARARPQRLYDKAETPVWVLGRSYRTIARINQLPNGRWQLGRIVKATAREVAEEYITRRLDNSNDPDASPKP